MESISSGDIRWPDPRKSGYSNSKAMLIENAYYILTPTPQVAEEKVQTYEKFVESLKALPVILDYQLHDQITGTISHLPHIIASSLVNFVKNTIHMMR